MQVKRKSSVIIRRRKKLWIIGAAAVLVIGLITGLLLIILTKPAAENTTVGDKPKQDYIIYRDVAIPIADGVAENPYDKDLFVMQDNGRMIYDSDEVTTYAGIDVSTHQNHIDWTAVKNSGVDFAMIRAGFRGATEGQIYIDNQFAYNINGALAVGIDVGIYFFSQAITVEEAREEVDVLLRWIKGYDVTYPIVFDWEFQPEIEDNRTGDMTGELLTDIAIEFCNQVYRAGYTPMVYFNLDLGYMYYDLNRVSNYDFWVAEHDERAPNFYYDFTMYQYTNRCVVPGVPVPVDMNLCFVDYKNKAD